jgi:glycerophosphoryl diester phosphodiesterase
MSGSGAGVPFGVAHRTPDTAAACRALAGAGASAFELDVQYYRGTVVVSHYLPVLKIRGWLQNDGRRFRWSRHPSPDPELPAVLDLIPPRCTVLLDLKEELPHRRAALNELLGRLPDRDRFRVSTPIIEDLEVLRAAGFRTWRTIRNPRALDRVLRQPQLNDHGVSIHWGLLRAGVVAALRERGVLVVAWPVNRTGLARRLLALGVDGITTDNPAVLALTKHPA